MPYTCRNCKRTFASELELDLHRDSCADGKLFCTECGERFSEGAATTDGWHYRCPTDGCDGTGIGEQIQKVTDVRLEVS